jgi:hypothetical protein
MFVMNGKHRAVLISYPTPEQVRTLADPTQGGQR